MPSVGVTAWEDGLFAIYICVVLGTLCGLGRLLLEWQPDARLWVSSACRALAPEGVAEEVLTVARARVVRQREVQFRRFFCIMGVGSSTACIFFMGQIILQHDRAMTKVQDVCLFTMMTTSMLIIFSPGIITIRTMDWFYVALMFWTSIMVAPFSVHPGNVMGPVLMAIAFANSLCFVRMSSNKWSFIHLVVCNVLMIVSVRGTLDKYAVEFTTFRNRLMGSQAMLVAACAGCAHCLELSMQSAEVRAVQLQVASEEKGAAWALLRSICDVVVELDEEGIVANQAADFASFLLRGSTSLKGFRLSDLVTEEDRERLEARLRAPAQESLAENIPLSLRDGDGNRVKVEVLLLPFCHMGSQRRFLAGIRESSDGFFCRREPGHETASSPHEQRLGCGHRTAAVPCTALGAESFALPETASISPSFEDPAAAVAAVDYLLPGMPVRRVSAGFCLRIGRLAPDSLLCNVVADPRALSQWVDLVMVATRPVPDHPVTLLMPQGPMRAMCRVVENNGTDESSSEQCLVCLSFSGITADQRSSRRSSQKGTPLRKVSI